MIDGVNKVIRSDGYNAATHTGWMTANDCSFEFGGNANNYLKWNGSTLNIR